jgi:predicted permease
MLDWLRPLAGRLDPRARDPEMDEEMALHIELHAESLERQGLSHAGALRRARIDFGGVQRYREEARETHPLSWFSDLAGDLRYGARALSRSPGFALTAILSLGFGIGANTAVFGLLYGVLMQPLPIPHANELTVVAIVGKDDRYTSVLRTTFEQLRALPGAPRFHAIHDDDHTLIEGDGYRSYVHTNLVDGGLFPMLGVQPLLGRYITPSDDSAAAPVALIGEDLWTYAFARSAAILGRRVMLRSHPFTIIGVMPRAYRGPMFNGSFTVAVPASTAPLFNVEARRDYVIVLARLDNPRLRESLAPPLDSLWRRCCASPESVKAGEHLTLVDASRGVTFGKNDFRDDYRLILWSLMGGVFLVLLIACSNVGNLLLARGAARERELAVRLSLGASRTRIVRQLLAESALLAAIGAFFGIALAAWGTAILSRKLPTGVADATGLVEFHAKPVILWFTATVGVVSVLAFGLGPALRATRGDLISPLRERAAGRSATGRIVDRLLVVGQVAVTLVLVCGAGLLVATVHNLRTIDPGFASDHLVAVSAETRGTQYERAGIVPIHQDILERVRVVSGVRSVAMSTRVPAIGGRNASFPYRVIGRSTGDTAQLSLTVITPRYFVTTGTRLLAGRDFTSGDTPASGRVAIVNASFVRRHFPNGDSPLGAQVQLDELNGGETVTIVGVAQDMLQGDRRTPQPPSIYVPVVQAGNWPFLLIVMRTAGEPHAVAASVLRALGPYARTLQITGSQTMDEAFDEVVLRERLAASLAATSAGLALCLAMVGLSGLIGFAVVRRTREIGVRMALGARRFGIVWMVLRGALTTVGVGVLIGTPLALAAGHVLSSMLYGVAAGDLATLAAATFGLALTGLLASALPAWRASRVDPVISLRAD